METVRSIMDIDSNPWLVLFLALFAFILGSGITTVLGLVFAPMFCSKAKRIRIFGLTLERQSDGKWEKRDAKFYFGFAAEFSFDLKKAEGLSQEQLAAKESLFLIISCLVSLLITGSCAALGVLGGLCIESDFLASVVYWTGIALFIFDIVRFGIRLFLILRVNAQNSLGGYVQTALGKIRAGVPMAQLDLKPVMDLDFKKVMRAEKIMYFPIYFTYLDASGQYDLMAAAVGDIENEMRPAATTGPEMMAAATLVYYYSYHYVDVRKAKEYYHRMGDTFEKDKDANVMRIKGFYNLNCFGDVNSAINCLNAAKASVDSFSSGSEREYERTCIAKLEAAINRFMEQG